ncbi:hypothetical protein O9K51_05328 [Purpureocillium lavendulum]|uniref:Protein kinase domain-containing protein n=1 Tax=Purpureocillium lavendulum TaxID=1247861 RepID=A0AB34FR55_9HYPO|nr:hypothetical protein O9K51_05328 [Purpureocillium lavendulum]
MLKAPSLETVFDENEETNGDDECKAWLSRLFDAKIELATFVAGRRGGGKATEYVGFLQGSFNLSFRFRFGDGGPDALIRFPKPGHTAAELRDEKVTNEVQVMEFLRQNSTIPIPHIIFWGLIKASPQQHGPFIIMDYVEGTPLSTLLKKPMKSEMEDLVLDPGVQLMTPFWMHRIGAISRDGLKWSVTERPLTYNMNELATVARNVCQPHKTQPTDRSRTGEKHPRPLALSRLGNAKGVPGSRARSRPRRPHSVSGTVGRPAE